MERKKAIKILMCGDRNWRDGRTIEAFIKLLPPDETEIIVGDCRGADTIAADLAKFYGFKVDVHKADWDRYRGAGPRRNQEMINREPDMVVAFHNNIVVSRGTIDTLRRAERANIPYMIISSLIT